MCTSIAMGNFFGRNMDIDYSFGECAVNTPRDFPLKFKKTEAIPKHYAFIGTAAVADGYPLYAEAMNENGLYAAALKFPENAFYNETEESGKINLAPYEIIPYILGKCRSIGEAKTALSETEIIAIPFEEKLPLSPLHWHIADKEKSIVLEKTAEGMKIYDNPAGVLTNNPPFPFHLQNRINFSSLTPKNPEGEKTALGLGAVGLAGDFSPASRFTRADFLLKNTPEIAKNANQLFHILDNCAIPKGAVITPDGKFHYTSYCSAFNGGELTFHYKTYDNPEIKTARLEAEGDRLTVLEMNMQIW